MENQKFLHRNMDLTFSAFCHLSQNAKYRYIANFLPKNTKIKCSKFQTQKYGSSVDFKPKNIG